MTRGEASPTPCCPLQSPLHCGYYSFPDHSAALQTRLLCSAAASLPPRTVCQEAKMNSDQSSKKNTLNGKTGLYIVEDFVDEGAFGKVVKCVEARTKKKVAVKILKTKKTSEREIRMLEAVKAIDPVKNNIVCFIEWFVDKGHTCLAFEMLDKSLWHLWREQHFEPLSLYDIRPIAHQLLTALDALKGIGVIHSDLKLDNIMLVNHEDQPFRVKLIDFGMSFKTSEASNFQGQNIQALGYRAPEVILGLPITEAIDMWGLGCLLGCLYTGRLLFSRDNEYQMLMCMVETLGKPCDRLLCAGKYTRKFFKECQHLDYPKWWLKTPMEFQRETGIQIDEWKKSICLEALVKLPSDTQESILLEDRRAFVSFLKGLLHMDARRRSTPRKALKHSFVSMGHLRDKRDTSTYAKSSFRKMGDKAHPGARLPRDKEKKSLLKRLGDLVGNVRRILCKGRNKVVPADLKTK